MSAIDDLLLGIKANQAAGGYGPITSPTEPAPPPAPIQAPAPVVQAEQLPEQEVVGDPWHPHKMSVLGTIADVLMGGPWLTNANNRRNMREALQGFQSDPEKAIRRVAQISPKTAWAMYNQYQDNKRADELQKFQQDKTYWDRGMALLSAANPKNYQAVKQRFSNYMQAHNIDPGFDLPDEFNQEEIDAARETGMSAYQQMQYEATDEDRRTRTEWFKKNIDSQVQTREANSSSLQDYRKARLGQMGARDQEQGRHNRAMEQGRPNGQVYGVQTKYGPGQVNKDGTLTVVVNGKEHTYVKMKDDGKGNAQWKLMPEVDEGN